MLFDLRGRGRHRTVQIVYATLAVLMAAGLILFGVGSGLAGGLIDALNGNSGSSSNGNSALTKQADTLQKRAQQNPQVADNWIRLARAKFQLAAGSIDQSTGQYSADGRKNLAAAGVAWDRYLALNPDKPDPTTATLMVQAFVQLNQIQKAADAQEIVTGARPNRNAYLQLAKLAYAAGQTRKGDLAAQKALAQTPKDLRGTLKTQLDQAKQAGTSATGGGANGTAGSTGGSTPPPTSTG
jgi:tetratricopeptide (TPR) repeat protein